MSRYCSVADLFELTHRVLCDPWPTKRPDMLYLFGQTEHNQESSLFEAMRLWRQGRVDRIGITALPQSIAPRFGFPGYEAWRGILIDGGVDENSIIPIPPAIAPPPQGFPPEVQKEIECFLTAGGKPPSTDAEAIGLVRFMAENRWTSVVLCSPPLHQFRAFVSTVGAAHYNGIRLLIYNWHGQPQEWDEETIHSQGIATGTRATLLTGQELPRLIRYLAARDHLSAAQNIRYLMQRRNKP